MAENAVRGCCGATAGASRGARRDVRPVDARSVAGLGLRTSRVDRRAAAKQAQELTHTRHAAHEAVRPVLDADLLDLAHGADHVVIEPNHFLAQPLFELNGRLAGGELGDLVGVCGALRRPLPDDFHPGFLRDVEAVFDGHDVMLGAVPVDIDGLSIFFLGNDVVLFVEARHVLIAIEVDCAEKGRGDRIGAERVVVGGVVVRIACPVEIDFDFSGQEVAVLPERGRGGFVGRVEVVGLFACQGVGIAARLERGRVLEIKEKLIFQDNGRRERIPVCVNVSVAKAMSSLAIAVTLSW